MRTLVDIPENDIRKLDALAARTKRSRAAEIRDAVARHLREEVDKSWIYGEGFGYWKDRDDIGDAVEYQRDMRRDRDEP
ncbi:ribbon-helix-helix protein, CopG family [uncultured Sphingomonas sp.]|uniref:ribbon-helix-helix protein, CopG family n=1 Tax=uncultured Sphingomonas sp. TaxID=158754 RepID=UPI0035CA9DE4